MTAAALARPSNDEILDRLTALRSRMKIAGVDAYLIPSEDAHQVSLYLTRCYSKSEYTAAHDGRRSYISNFTGSAGYALVTQSSAHLWTDGRYFLQAQRELPPFIELMRMGVKGTLSINECVRGMRMGIDAKLVSLTDVEKYKDCDVDYMQQNLIDLDWKAQPAIPANQIITHDIKYSGKATLHKLIDFRAIMRANGVTVFILTTLDEIAWLFNLRGSDIPFNPVFFSYAIVHLDGECVLYTNAEVTASTQAHLVSITTRHYRDVFADVPKLHGVVGVDTRCNKALYDLIKCKVIVTKSPVLLAKAIKNDVETAGMEACHLRDAAALCNFFGWLNNELKTRSISECESADVLESFRAKQTNFMGLSFDTISGSGPNGAIIHYKPEPETCAMVTTSQMYLLDSGGQYRDGTTDVTRTFHFGTPTQNEKHHYTLVLKSHIAVDSVEFPVGTTGYILDVVARQGMWKEGLDYKHGTGHGVGSFLNVHEGPHGIGIRIAYNDAPLQAGMIVTNEPGLYFEGKYGIRIENVIKCVSVGEGFLGFRPVTYVPMYAGLIEMEIMTVQERAWVNDYHEACLARVEGLLEKGSLGHAYLVDACKPL